MDELNIIMRTGVPAFAMLLLGVVSTVCVLVVGTLLIRKKQVPAILAVAPLGLAACVVLVGRVAHTANISYAAAHATAEMKQTLAASSVSSALGLQLTLGWAVTVPCVLAVLLAVFASLRSEKRGLVLPGIALACTALAMLTPAVLYFAGIDGLGAWTRVLFYLVMGIGTAIALSGRDPAAKSAGMLASCCFAIAVGASELQAITRSVANTLYSMAILAPGLKQQAGAEGLELAQWAGALTLPLVMAALLLPILALGRRMDSPTQSTLAAMAVGCAVVCAAVFLNAESPMAWLMVVR